MNENINHTRHAIRTAISSIEQMRIQLDALSTTLDTLGRQMDKANPYE
jgi:hypothetical protein